MCYFLSQLEGKIGASFCSEIIMPALSFSFPTTNTIMEDLKEIVFDKLIPATQMLQLRFNYHYQH